MKRTRHASSPPPSCVTGAVMAIFSLPCCVTGAVISTFCAVIIAEDVIGDDPKALADRLAPFTFHFRFGDDHRRVIADFDVAAALGDFVFGVFDIAHGSPQGRANNSTSS